MIKRFVLCVAAISLLMTQAFGAHARAPATAPAAQPTPAPAAAAPAAPVATNTIQLVWEVYITGLKIGMVGLKTDFAPGSYSSASMLKTGGLIGLFYSSRITATSVGAIAGATLRPRNYDADANSRKRQKTQLSYTTNGVQLFADPAYDTERFPVTEEQKRDTLDPVSAMTFAVSGLSVTAEHPCGDTLHVFDGARRYDVAFRFIANETLAGGSEGYSGPVVKCEVLYQQIAGFKPSVNQGKKSYPIYVWGAAFATQQGSGPMHRFVVPVKIQTETSFGTAEADASLVKIDDQKR